MNADIQTPLALAVYALALLLIALGAYFGWKWIRPHCRRYGSSSYDDRVSERKKFWGYE